MIRERQDRILEEQRKRLLDLQQLPDQEAAVLPSAPASPGLCFDIRSIQLKGDDLISASRQGELLKPFEHQCLYSDRLNKLLSFDSLSIYAHSQGGLLTRNALGGLKFKGGSKIQLSGAPVDGVEFHETAQEAGFNDKYPRVFQVNRTDEKNLFGLPKVDAVADLLGGNAKYLDTSGANGAGAVSSLFSLFTKSSPHSNYSCIICPSSSESINNKLRDMVIPPTLIYKDGSTRRLE